MEIFERLLKINTAPGAEKAVSDAISEYLEEVSDSIRTDKCGNLIVSMDMSKTKEKRINIAVFVPMDAPGLIVNFIEDNGNVCVSPLGKLEGTSWNYAKITNGDMTGILVPDGSDGADVTKAYADFGFGNKEQAEEHMKLGDVLYYESVPVYLNNGKVSAHGVSVKACVCAVCLAAKETERQTGKNFYFVFCSQSKLISRGAYQAAFGVNPDMALCVDAYKGDGIAVKMLDKSLVCDEKLTELLEKVCTECGIKAKRYVSDSEISDASRVQSASSGVSVSSVLLPVKNMGTPAETVDTKDIEMLSNIIVGFLNGIEW